MSDWYRAWVVITRAAVPALSLFSGYLLAGEPQRPVWTIARRKFARLLLPFLFWNSLGFAAVMLHGQFWPGSPAEGWSDLSRYAIINGLTGLHGAPFNYPLYFLRDMFISVVAIGLLRPVLRHSGGLCAAMCVLLLNYAVDLDDRLILRNTIPLFLLMGFAMRMNPAIAAWCARACPGFAVAAVLVLPVCAFTELDWGLPSVLDLLVLGVCAALVIGLAARLPPLPRMAAWGRDYAFPVFLSHAWVLMGLQLLWQRQGWGTLSFGIAGMAGALLAGVLVAWLAKRLPAPFGLLLTGRDTARRPAAPSRNSSCRGARAVPTPVA